MRYYLPKLDVRMELLESSPTRSRCPYKGEASYWHVGVRDDVLEDLAWSYREPIPECPKIENLVSCLNERVDTFVEETRRRSHKRTGPDNRAHLKDVLPG